jgi:mannan polymerase II complex MNN11 subunit
LRLPRNKRVLAAIALGVIVFFYLVSSLLRRGGEYIPPGTPRVVIVTTIDPKVDPAFTERIRANRLDYASRHGTDLSGVIEAHCCYMRKASC